MFKKISDLSGGERGRVSLAKLMLSEANFLILDEPTNHLDITSKEILEQALLNYTGTVLYVSHDRYFINQTATRILELTGHTLINYIGNYDYYVEKREDMAALYTPNPTQPDTATAQKTAAPLKISSESRAAAGSGQMDWKAQKEEQARIRKLQNDLKKTEDQIQQLEIRDSEIDSLLQQEDIYTDVSRLMELNQEKEEIKSKLEELYEHWEALAENQ